MPMDTTLHDQPGADERTSRTIQRWGGIASFVMVAAFFAAHAIYLTGKLEEPYGPLSYSLADFLYGVVWSAGLVIMVYALRERIGDRAPRLMTIALLLALAAGAAFLTVASVRSANRYYHLTHPTLRLELSPTVLTVWATLVAGITGAAFHFLGWAFILIGTAGWISQRLPRLLNVLYGVVGVLALAVYLFPPLSDTILMPVMVVVLWQGIVLWMAAPAARQSPKPDANLPAQA